MLKIKRVVAVSILVFLPLALFAQNNTNSPYTRYGYGELADRSFGAGRAMGGVGFGMRSSKQINPLNPASYTGMDSLTFLLDFGVAGQLSWFDDGSNKQSNINGNFEYAAIQFPIHRRIALSVGLLPISYVGYHFGSSKTVEGISYVEEFSGSGGLNDVYLGLSVDIWKKRLSVGANVGYLFGTIAHNQSVVFSSTGATSSTTSKSMKVNDIKLDLGIQYTHPLSARESFVIGVAYSPKNKLNTTSYEINVSGNTLEKADTTRNQLFDMPQSIGAGVSYVKQNKLTLAADFLYEDWNKARFFDRRDEFKQRIRVAAGGEFIPAYQNKAFFNRIKYRAGVHYSNSYLRVKGSSYDEYGASIGFGLPLIDNRSLLNLSLEYVKIQPGDKTLLISEQYFRFTVNYTFNELWFLKFKVN
ncbi:MAG: hypothetical protein LBQ39_07105 [Tannerellaceae bacterium]|jgi:hypothetical protein|nr:hypothetical protein [Tannerellaceae bacterium]